MSDTYPVASVTASLEKGEALPITVSVEFDCGHMAFELSTDAALELARHLVAGVARLRTDRE